MMDLSPERWQLLDGLMEEALGRPPDERTAFLRVRCGGDPALYEEAVVLLARLHEAERVVGESVRPLAAGVYEGDEAADAVAPGTLVGAYRIEEEVGRGGMGVVYRATRADGAFRKTVALKLVKRGMDTDEVLARFRRERQVLAGLDHPGIARLLDGGAAEDGRPYLVTEYVEGEPITAYCDRRRLDVAARLELFEGVCEGVQHAHRRLVVHRDLKPSNVLVAESEDGTPPASAGAGSVKLLDFGIAKLLAEREDESVTRTGAQRLTPAYAAPEQVRGEAVTTATDVYSLGVMLYELLAGQRPEGGLRPPSGAVTPETAEARSSSPERLCRRLQGDLDTIVQKALREEPEARYPSVEALLADLRRHRMGLPVLARPASPGYRVGKFVRRHRAGVAASGAFVLLLVAAVVALGFQQRQTVRERDRAEAAAQQAREATRFLASIFAGAIPKKTGGEELSARQVLDRGLVRAGEELAGEPELQARLYYIIGDVYQSMELNEAARDACARSLALQRELYGPVHPEVASSLFCLAAAHYVLGDAAAADSLFGAYEAMLTVLPAEASPEHARRFRFMGGLLQYRGDLDRALTYRTEAHAIHQQLDGPVDLQSIASGIEVAATLRDLDRMDEALAMLQAMLSAIEGLPSSEKEGERLRSAALIQQAGIYRSRGQLQEAGRGYREVIAIWRRLSPESSMLADHLRGYGELLAEAGRYAEAEGAYREAREGFRRHYGEGSFYALHVQRLLGEAVRDQGRFADAEPLLREAFTLLQEERGAADAFTQGALRALVTLYERWGRPEQAAAYRPLLAETGA